MDDQKRAPSRPAGIWASTPAVRIVSDHGNDPVFVPTAGPRKELQARRFEAWVVIVLLCSSTLLAVFDLYLLSTGLK